MGTAALQTMPWALLAHPFKPSCESFIYHLFLSLPSSNSSNSKYYSSKGKHQLQKCLFLEFSTCKCFILGAAMAIRNSTGISFRFFLILSTIFFGSLPMPGYGSKDARSLLMFQKELQTEVLSTEDEQGYSKEGVWRWGNKNARRLMIGSTAPTCTYNECRGCRFKCSAEQVPVDANDPINSAYHYRCVCHHHGY